MRIQFGGAVKGLFDDVSGGPTDGFNAINVIFGVGDHTFSKADYPDYTNYDVIVIAGGGGEGGAIHGVDPSNSNQTFFIYGGQGGGGGFHRVSGLLEILGDDIAVHVGAAGENGTSSDDPDTATDGDDGDSSSFGSIAVASPGLGGKHATSLDSDDNWGNDGGLGGLGGISEAVDFEDRLVAGGIGGIADLNNDPEDPGNQANGVNGGDGKLVTGPVDVGSISDYPIHVGTNTLAGKVGQGGGGGAGGTVVHNTADDTWMVRDDPTNGGRGSYDSAAEVYSPYGSPKGESPTDSPNPFLAGAGRAGGARATPFNKSNATYGDSNKDGLVIIRLSAA